LAANGLVKRDIINPPDPVAVLTIDGDQSVMTAVARRTTNPTWDERFDV
jgi:E3 ubiquitin-protein ligase NEDD4